MTAPDLDIRAATAADVATLATFATAMALETENKRLDIATVTRGIERVLAEPAHGRYLVAAQAGNVVGTLMLTYEWSDWRCADWWWIQSVYVAKEARRQGVYAAMYRHVLAEIDGRRDVCGLRLYVESENHRAQKTYEGLGMERSHYHQYEYAQPWLSEVINTR
ncbi:MAG: GNAT family N-acetyltransferase [Lysobacteraceae bacterium]